jgi:predicted lipid-binding transport protein (Tim44 family)
MANRRIHLSGPPSGNPLLNGLMVVIGLLALGTLILLGVLAFLVIASIISVLAGIIGLRLWWQTRKVGQGTRREQRNARTGSLIEGEYRRVSSRRDREP